MPVAAGRDPSRPVRPAPTIRSDRRHAPDAIAAPPRPRHDSANSGRVARAGRPACAFPAQVERARPAAGVHRPEAALPLRQPGVLRLDRQAGRGCGRPRGHRGHRARCLRALRGLHRGSPRRRAHRLRASAGVAGPADDLDSRRLLPGTQRAGPGARLPGDVQRRRPPEVARTRGGAARAPAAAGHRQRRFADSLFRPPAQGPLRQQAVRERRRRGARGPARPDGARGADAGRLRGDAGLHRAGVRRRDGGLGAPGPAARRRAALDAGDAVSRPRALGTDRRCVRGAHRHRG